MHQKGQTQRLIKPYFALQQHYPRGSRLNCTRQALLLTVNLPESIVEPRGAFSLLPKTKARKLPSLQLGLKGDIRVQFECY